MLKYGNVSCRQKTGSRQSYELIGYKESETVNESRYRRNIRRKNKAVNLAWKQIRLSNNRDESGHLVRPRIANCGRSGYHRGSTDVSSKGKITGLQYCENSWSCPTCSEIIKRSREKEIEKGVEIHLNKGGSMLLVTYTIQHHKGQNLDDLLKTLCAAFSYSVSNHSRLKKLMKKSGVIGRIRTLEIVYGKNGWHPHFHAAFLLDKQLPDNEIKTLIHEWKMIWIECVNRFGGYSSYENGLDIEVAKDLRAVGRYICKELTNAADAKIGHGISPFQLLDKSDKESEYLWNEYVIATKNKRMTTWSRGLKALLNINDLTDSEIIKQSEQLQDDEQIIAHIDSEIWNDVYSHAALSEQVLKAIEARDYEYASILLRCSYYVLSDETIMFCKKKTWIANKRWRKNKYNKQKVNR